MQTYIAIHIQRRQGRDIIDVPKPNKAKVNPNPRTNLSSSEVSKLMRTILLRTKYYIPSTFGIREFNTVHASTFRRGAISNFPSFILAVISR